VIAASSIRRRKGSMDHFAGLDVSVKETSVVMRPIDEDRDNALIFTGIGSLFTAIAAVLLDYPMFATIFAFFSAFAVTVALRNEWERRR
jgi:hypothetical protein